jgi:hypothetical protein
MWPTFEELKASLERWFKSNHPNYLKGLENTEWANAFSGRHHSSVIIVNYKKMFNFK